MSASPEAGRSQPAWAGRLLVVEDNDLDFERIERTVSRLGFRGTLHRAADGTEALGLLGEPLARTVGSSRSLVMLLDLNLSGMSGLDLLGEIRADPKLNHVAVHVLSTSTRPADIATAWQRGVSGYHVKPTSLAELQTLVTVLLDLWARTMFAPEPAT